VGHSPAREIVKFAMAKYVLDGPELLGRPVDQPRLGAPQRVGAIGCWVEPNRSHPGPDDPRMSLQESGCSVWDVEDEDRPPLRVALLRVAVQLGRLAAVERFLLRSPASGMVWQSRSPFR
jgi:hypothetical protein